MEQQVIKVMALRIEPIEGIVRYMGKPCYREPETGVEISKGPFYALNRKPVFDIGVVKDV